MMCMYKQDYVWLCSLLAIAWSFRFLRIHRRRPLKDSERPPTAVQPAIHFHALKSWLISLCAPSSHCHCHHDKYLCLRAIISFSGVSQAALPEDPFGLFDPLGTFCRHVDGDEWAIIELLDAPDDCFPGYVLADPIKPDFSTPGNPSV